MRQSYWNLNIFYSMLIAAGKDCHLSCAANTEEAYLKHPGPHFLEHKDSYLKSIKSYFEKNSQKIYKAKK